jgi:hypothetical protein
MRELYPFGARDERKLSGMTPARWNWRDGADQLDPAILQF